MLIDRSHRIWGFSILLATLITSLLYVFAFHPAWLPFLPQPPAPKPDITPGRTFLGLVYGSLALAIFVFCCLLGWRRKRLTWPIGSLQSWLRAHIWLSIFTIPLVLMHAGFVMGGPMTTLLMALYALVMISGFFGLALQQYLPRMMAEKFPTEVVYEQIPYLQSQLLLQAQAIYDDLVTPPTPTLAPVAAGIPADDPPAVAPPIFPQKVVQEFGEEVISYLQAKNGGGLPLGTLQGSEAFFRRMRMIVPHELEPTVTELQGICDERRQLDLQSTYQHWLHGWLLVHAPISLTLLLLTIWHAIVTQFFG